MWDLVPCHLYTIIEIYTSNVLIILEQYFLIKQIINDCTIREYEVYHGYCIYMDACMFYDWNHDNVMHDTKIVVISIRALIWCLLPIDSYIYSGHIGTKTNLLWLWTCEQSHFHSKKHHVISWPFKCPCMIYTTYVI